jgi:DGQHR domain-containing protein
VQATTHLISEGYFIVATITVPAARAQQGNLSILATAIKVGDLVRPGFYSVDTLDPEDGGKGYQRLLNTARARRLADYIVAGQDSQDAFLPTSVFLATDKTLYPNATNNTVTIDTEAVGPFSVVDGQHRLEGLKLAAEKDPRVLDFEVPVNIATGLTPIAQMCHFLIVNTTQKSVDKAVEQRIVARLTDALTFEDIPSLPRWILKTVEKGEVDKALKLVDYLNTEPGSPWLGKIQMANDEAAKGAVNQRSFVKAIIKFVLTSNNPLGAFKDFEKEKKAFLNYWKAIAALLDDGEAGTLYKYNGIELFCRFSIPFFTRMFDRKSFTVDAMQQTLSSCFDAMDGEWAGVGHPEFWHSGGKSSFLNAAALSFIVQEMALSLHKTGMSTDVEI